MRLLGDQNRLCPFEASFFGPGEVLIRRLCRLAKLGLGECGGCYGEEEHEGHKGNNECRTEKYRMSKGGGTAPFDSLRTAKSRRGAFYPMYFGAVCLGKWLQTGRRVVYLTGQPGVGSG